MRLKISRNIGFRIRFFSSVGVLKSSTNSDQQQCSPCQCNRRSMTCKEATIDRQSIQPVDASAAPQIDGNTALMNDFCLTVFSCLQYAANRPTTSPSTDAMTPWEIPFLSHHVLVPVSPVLPLALFPSLQPLVGDGVPVDGGVVDRAGSLPRHHDGGVVLGVRLDVLRLRAAGWRSGNDGR